MFEFSQSLSPRLPAFPPPSPPPLNAAPRRRWTAGELTEAVTALATYKTADIANTLGVNPKALRAVLRRNGISLRALRNHASREKTREAGGIAVRRPADGPSAAYGAAALVELPDGACRWPLGDPAEPDFAFCGARKLPGRSYCPAHQARAFERRDDDGC